MYWPCTHWLIRLQSGAVEMQHNNRKWWGIGSILRSDPQLFDWFSFNWLSSPTWHHQSFALEVRQMKWLYITSSMIRRTALETFKMWLQSQTSHHIIIVLMLMKKYEDTVLHTIFNMFITDVSTRASLCQCLFFTYVITLQLHLVNVWHVWNKTPWQRAVKMSAINLWN